MTDLPWSDSGLQLLKDIQEIIESYGGNDKFAILLQKEAPEFFGKPLQRKKQRAVPCHKHIWTKEQDTFIKDKWDSMTLDNMKLVLGQSEKMISIRGKELGLGRKIESMTAHWRKFLKEKVA